MFCGGKSRGRKRKTRAIRYTVPRTPKDREVDEGEREDKESGKQAKFYFRGLNPFLFPIYDAMTLYL